MRKRSETAVLTKKNLLTAFWKLYENKNIEQIRIKELTDLAGYHRATFYQYYADIFDVLHQEEEELINEIEKISAFKSTKMSMDEILEQIAGFYIKNGKRLSLLVGPGGDPGFIGKLKDTIYPSFKLAGALPDDISSKMVFEFGINGLLMTFSKWYRHKSELPVEKFIQIARAILLTGIPGAIEMLQNHDISPKNRMPTMSGFSYRL